jgi:hypothetical protein
MAPDTSVMTRFRLSTSLALLFAAALNLAAAQPARATTWLVRSDGSAPLSSIQAAVNLAADQDTVDVGPGIYYEQVSIVDKTLLVKGAGRDLTTIDAQIFSPVPDQHGHVMALRGTDNYTEIRSLTMKGGNADTYAEVDGGIYGGGVLGDGAVFALVDCRITDCFALSLGGGIYATSVRIAPENGAESGPRPGLNRARATSHQVITIRNCLIDGNVAGAEGGGFCIEQGYFVIEDCLIKDNETGHGGGGRIFNSFGRLSRSIIWNNEAYLDGGGLDTDMGLPSATTSILIESNTIVGNRAGRDGSAAYITLGTTISYERNIFALNGGTAASVIYCELDDAVYAGGCNLFWQNAEESIGDCTPLPTDEHADPSFCSAAAGDFRVCEGSPAASGNCGPRGALGIGCTGPGCTIATVPVTWSAVKSLFR